ncbi:MAG: hypothetical protein PUF12_00475 [Thermoflexaceae bacterium]|nr:hypothetical protein [Thermoflexaceae bacterium]
MCIVVVGNCVNIDTKNSVVYSSGRLVTTLGLDNAVDVETEDGGSAETEKLNMILNILKAACKEEHILIDKVDKARKKINEILGK